MEPPKKRARLVVPDSEVQKVDNLKEYQLTDMPDAEVFYVPDFIDETVASKWYAELLELESWYRPQLKVFGKEVTQSRQIAAYATDTKLTLKYSGHMMNMLYEYPPVLRQIQDEVEKRLGVTFNHVMLNLYENGNIYIGNHRDNLENRVIASVSLGAPRTFIMTHDVPNRAKLKKSAVKKSTAVPAGAAESSKPTQRETSTTSLVHKKRWTLATGSLVVMQGDTQRHWKHEIPREPGVKEGRISLTFRQLLF